MQYTCHVSVVNKLSITENDKGKVYNKSLSLFHDTYLLAKNITLEDNMAILPADNKISLACDFADLGDRLEIKNILMQK